MQSAIYAQSLAGVFGRDRSVQGTTLMHFVRCVYLSGFFVVSCDSLFVSCKIVNCLIVLLFECFMFMFLLYFYFDCILLVYQVTLLSESECL